MEDREKWDLIIEPSQRLHFRSFFTFLKYRDLLLLLVKRDFTAYYKQTILGPAWLVVQPLMMSLVYWFLFDKIATLGTDEIPPFLFYLSGAVCWAFFSESLSKISTVYKDNAALFGKVYFPRIIVPLSILLGNAVRLGIQLILFAAFMTFFILTSDWKPEITWKIIFFFLTIVYIGLLALSIGLFIASITVRYRDLAFLVGFGVQILLFVSPVVYPVSEAPEQIKRVLFFNPLTAPFEGLRIFLFGKGTLTAEHWIYSGSFLLVMLVFSTYLFTYMERKFTDTV